MNNYTEPTPEARIIKRYLALSPIMALLLFGSGYGLGLGIAHGADFMNLSGHWLVEPLPWGLIVGISGLLLYIGQAISTVTNLPNATLAELRGSEPDTVTDPVEIQEN